MFVQNLYKKINVVYFNILREKWKKKKIELEKFTKKNMLKFTDMLQIVENWHFAYRTQCRIRFWHILFEKSGVSIKRFSHSELEILNILTEIPSISKKRYEIQRFKWPLCIYQSIDFCRKLHMRRLIGKYYMPVPQIIKKTKLIEIQDFKYCTKFKSSMK